MVVAVLRVRLLIEGAGSLKEKRKVLRSTKDRLKKMNISVAEVDDQDKWQSSVLGISAVSGDSAYVNGVMDKVMDCLNSAFDYEVVDSEIEIIHL